MGVMFYYSIFPVILGINGLINKCSVKYYLYAWEYVCISEYGITSYKDVKRSYIHSKLMI